MPPPQISAPPPVSSRDAAEENEERQQPAAKKQVETSPQHSLADYPEQQSDDAMQPASFKDSFLPPLAEKQVESGPHSPLADYPDDTGLQPASHMDSPASARGDDSEAGALPPMVLRRPRQSKLALILLVFLIHYCVATTGVIAYLLYQQRVMNQFDPLERLPDPQAKTQDGGAARTGKA